MYVVRYLMYLNVCVTYDTNLNITPYNSSRTLYIVRHYSPLLCIGIKERKREKRENKSSNRLVMYKNNRGGE